MTATIDWDTFFSSHGVGWYCGHVFPYVPVGGVSAADVANMPRCDRWWPTRADREVCDHGLSGVIDDVAPFGVDDFERVQRSMAAIETTNRPNRWDGECLWCGGAVAAGCGLLVDIDGLLRPVHKDGDCA